MVYYSQHEAHCACSFSTNRVERFGEVKPPQFNYFHASRQPSRRLAWIKKSLGGPTAHYTSLHATTAWVV
jgi:hypothetical protein